MAEHVLDNAEILSVPAEFDGESLLEFRRGRGVSVVGTPERGAVVQRAKELVAFARLQGYRLDELVQILEDVG
jgi:hypothetical protein